jgi:flagellar basal body-associated protein FliL
MKRIEKRLPPATEIVYRVLIIIAALLVLIILIGTIYGLINKGKKPEKYSTYPEMPEGVFFGLGKMRIPTADAEPETLVISITFPYNKDDRPFSEELASRLSWFKEATAGYLGAFTAEELSVLDTDTVNKELLNRYNSVLRLGQIKQLYIDEYMRL